VVQQELAKIKDELQPLKAKYQEEKERVQRINAMKKKLEGNVQSNLTLLVRIFSYERNE
jgi:predicted transcriptional regulator